MFDFGDVYDTIGTCDELETQLSRLKRRGMIGHEEWLETKKGIAAIRIHLERCIPRPLN
jgi:hypothetical protein